MKMTMYPTNYTLIGRDKRTGRKIRRRIYEGSDCKRYVNCGAYAYEPNVYVGADWFALQHLNDVEWRDETA